MKRILSFTILLIIAVSIQAQHRFSMNKGQLPGEVLYKCRLNYGALFLERDALVYNFADVSQHQHSHAHHGESDVEESHHESHHQMPDRLDFHAYKVDFVGSLADVHVAGDDLQPDYENYFIGNNPANWASRVSLYGQIYYDNIYEGVDLVFYDEGKGLKYDWIVEPGGNPDHIRLRYTGLNDIRLRWGNLILETSLSVTKEMAPDAYQVIRGDSIPVRCQYVLEDSTVSFFFPDGYDPSADLVIDPSLVFSTYTGSTGDNWGFTATWDYNDNVFSGGIVFDVGYPVSLGAYQTDFAGGVAPLPTNPTYYGNGCDVGIIKYNSDGTQRLYATYLGGATGEEMPHSMVVNENNELIVFGTTGSTDFPVTANAYDATFNGGDSLNYDNVIAFPDGTDIYIAKLSEDGTQLLGGTYLGGTSNDGLNFKIEYTQQGYIQMHGNDSLYYNYGDGARGEVIADNKNYIYIGANTFSTDIAPGVNPGVQNMNAGGMDGLVAKFSPDLSDMIWMSYLGGSSDDAIYSIYPDLNYNVLVAGGTCSSGFPTTAGSFQTTYLGGSTDAFVAKISQNGDNLMASTFFGSTQYDQAHFVRIDDDNHVYIYGQTEAGGNTLIYNAGYSVPNSGQFLAAFTENLSDRLWSTVVGRGAGHPVLSPSAFAVDVCDRIYLAGWGREWAYSYLDETGFYYTWADDYGTVNLPVTSDALQTSTDGQDFYIMVLSENASALEYATFFGEQHYDACSYSGHDHVDGGTSRFDNKGNVIQSVCASCGSCQAFPTMPTPGVWSSDNASTNCNNAVFKINIIENLAESNFEPIPAICAPYDVQFVNNSQGVTYTWDFGDGSPVSNEFEPSHTYSEEGIYTVMLVAYDPASCNYADTSYRFVEVQTPDHIDLPGLLVCPGETVQIGPEELYGDEVTFEWIAGNGLSSTSVQNPMATPATDTEYILLVHDVCTDTLVQNVEIREIDLSVTMPPDTMICPGGTVSFEALVQGEYSGLIWSDNPGFTNTLSTTELLVTQPPGNTVYWFRASESECNTEVSGSVTAEIHQFNYQLSQNPVICPGATTELLVTNLNASDIISYSWSPDSFILSGENTANPIVQPNQTMTFTVSMTNQMGCETSDGILVTVDDLYINTPESQDPLCFGDCTGQLYALANGYPPYGYSWSNNAEGDTLTGLCAGSYIVTVTDDIGCTAVASAEIVQPPELQAQFVSVLEPQCDGIGYGAATVQAGGGTPGYSYLWDDGYTDPVNQTLLTGLHSVMVTDANGCDTMIEIEMVPPNNLATTINDLEDNPCYGDCEGSMTVAVSGGTPPFTYTWSNGQTSPSASELCAGGYTVTIIDADNCVIHQSGYISHPPDLIGLISADPIQCNGDSTDLVLSVSGGTSPYLFEWNNGESTSGLSDITVGEYMVTITDDHDCTDTAGILLTQPDPLAFDDVVINMLCTGVCNGKILIDAYGGTEPYEYFWSGEDGSNVLNDLCSGDYELLIRDGHGCETWGAFSVYNEGYVPPLDITATMQEIYVGMSTQLTATGNGYYTYDWFPAASLSSDGVPVVNAYPVETTTYNLRIVDSAGCVNTDTITIRVNELICGEPYLYVPNAFSPDDDGENDFFRPYAPVGVVKKMYFAVYNRWGELLYETDNINDDGWDGTYKGKKLPPDVYVFWFEATCIDDDEFIKKGNVTLLR